MSPGQPGSSSLRREGYWWHRARTDLLASVMAPHLATPSRTLDVGSADAPSVGWMRGEHQHVGLDLFPNGLRVSLPTDQIVAADDDGGRARVAFGGRAVRRGGR